MGAVDPGPLLGCVVRAALGGVAEGMVILSLEASPLLGPVSLSRSPSFATHLSAASRDFELDPLPVTTE